MGLWRFDMEQHAHPLDSEPVTHPKNQQAELSPDDQLTARYSDEITALVEDALKRGKQRILVNVITWHLARLITHYGVVAAGYILERLGSHLSYITECERAQAEIEAAKQSGSQSH